MAGCLYNPATTQDVWVFVPSSVNSCSGHRFSSLHVMLLIKLPSLDCKILYPLSCLTQYCFWSKNWVHSKINLVKVSCSWNPWVTACSHHLESAGSTEGRVAFWRLSQPYWDNTTPKGWSRFSWRPHLLLECVGCLSPSDICNSLGMVSQGAFGRWWKLLEVRPTGVL